MDEVRLTLKAIVACWVGAPQGYDRTVRPADVVALVDGDLYEVKRHFDGLVDEGLIEWTTEPEPGGGDGLARPLPEGVLAVLS